MRRKRGYGTTPGGKLKLSMRILQIGKFYPILGGVEKVMYDLLEGFSSRHVPCDMLCASYDGKPVTITLDGGAKVMACRNLMKLAGTMISPAMIYKAMRLCKHYDIVHVHHPDPTAALGLFLSGYKGKVILHWHSDILKQRHALKLYRPLQDWLIRRADLILGTSPVYLEQSPFLAGVQDKTAVLPIGVTPVPSDPEGVRRLRARYSGKRIVFSLGRLVPYKGFVYLVRAARYLPSDHVVLIGGSGPLVQELADEVVRCGVADRVKLLGRVPDEELPAYYGACDIFCLPSVQKTEAFGIVQIEAMSCGKPVVATRIAGSGVAWVNDHGVSGLNVPVEDPQALAEAIMAITRDDDTYRRYADGALRRYRTLFRHEDMVKRCMEYYKQVKNTPPRIVIRPSAPLCTLT